MKNTVLLIDGMNLIHRSNIKFGKSYSYTIIYNFIRSLKSIIEKFKPDKIFFCLEGKNNFRYSLYSEYKSNRIFKKSSNVNDNFIYEKNIIINILYYLPITVVSADKYEADDIIATLSENLKEENVIIISNDSDYIQLLQNGFVNLKIYNPSKKEFTTSPNFHYLLWKILRGDKTDNIPGIVSDEMALELSNNPDSLKLFLENEENRSKFNLNKELIELKNIPEEDIIFNTGSFNKEFIYSKFIEMKFNSLLKNNYWNKFCNIFEEI